MKDAPDVHRIFGDDFPVIAATRVALRAVEKRTEPENQDWIQALRFPPYYTKPVELQKYINVTSVLDAELILRDHRAHVFVSKEEVLYLTNMV